MVRGGRWEVPEKWSQENAETQNEADAGIAMQSEDWSPSARSSARNQRRFRPPTPLVWNLTVRHCREASWTAETRHRFEVRGLVTGGAEPQA